MSTSDNERKRERDEVDEDVIDSSERSRVKRLRREDDEEAGLERELLALHPSDEDLDNLHRSLLPPPSIKATDSTTLDVSPEEYPSSDGGGFQLMKSEKRKLKEEKKKVRKYRGAVQEENVEDKREGGKERRKGARRLQMKDEERDTKRSTSRHTSPYYGSDGGRTGREKRRERDDPNLLHPRSDDWHHSRDYRRGKGRREEERIRWDDYHQQRREGKSEEGRRRGRERRDDRRYSVSPRPSKSDWRGGLTKEPRERAERVESEEYSSEREHYERLRQERKHQRRQRSRDEKKMEMERAKKEKSESEEESSPGDRGTLVRPTPSNDKIDDLIKDLEELEEEQEQQQQDRDSYSEDEESEREGQREDIRHSSVSNSEGSERDIVQENISSDEEEREEEESHHQQLLRSETEPILRSKFDSSSSSSDEEGHPHQRVDNRTMKKTQSMYSGYSEAILATSDHSDVEVEVGPQLQPREEEEEIENLIPVEGVGDKEEKVEEVEEEEEEENEWANLPPYVPALMGCRNVEEYEWLNRIEEGTYGVVYRAKDKRSGEVVALKKLKMEKEKEGFPITSLREINMLLKAKHPNIVYVRELVVGSNMDRIYIVMDYVEHDIKALMETMKQPFLEGEVKTLLLQLLRAVHHLHDNWILHRDLKTSNLLLSHKGILKVGDFGLAREYGSPLRPYTPVVVTLWYRAPELLLGCKEYSTPIDMWSVGCIFAEFLQHKPIFMGKSEIDQLNQIFKELGTPSEEIWPGYNELPIVKKVTFTKRPYNNLRKRFPYLPQSGFELLNKFLTYDPKRRITAEKALEDQYFKESPLPVDSSMFPTWPAKSEKMRRKSREKSPTPPIGGNYLLSQAEEDGFRITTAVHGKAAVGAGFSLKF